MEILHVVRIKANKQSQEDGTVKKVSLKYLIEGVSFIDIETQVTLKLKELHGDFDIDSIQKTKFLKVLFADNGDTFFKAKIEFLIDSDKGTKKVFEEYVVKAVDIKQAFDVLHCLIEGEFTVLEIRDLNLVDYLQ